jgi:Na+/proline symporter
MNPYISLAILVAYFSMLIVVSIYTAKGADTNTFFTANKQSPWYLVAFGMIGTSLSGVTFVSVPGAVANIQFSYFQVVLGYIVGYIVIGTVLMPLYYRLNLISIYSYLEDRFGFWSYKTGSAVFLVSRTVGSAVRLYIAAQVLQLALFDPLGVPFEISVAITIILIWVYTFKGGVKTIIITDTLQTFFLISAVILTIVLVSQELHLTGIGDAWTTVRNSEYAQIFNWDLNDPKNFYKQFIAGAFIAIVMTGMDQDLMQKNLTCKNIGEAQKNMFWFTIVMVIVNFMFLCLGALLYTYAAAKGIPTLEKTDSFYPMLALNHLGVVVGITFLLGITAATYASSDSALTALTTAFCIDFMDIQNKPEEKRSQIKFWVHIGFSVLFYLVILLFNKLNSKEVITAVFDLAGYTYGPLLGLFSYGLIMKKQPVKDQWVPLLCIFAPIFTFILNENSVAWFGGYQFGFERLIINGLIVFVGLWFLEDKHQISKHAR